VAKSFKSTAGTIWFERIGHTWVSGKCRFCGANRATFDRAEGLETHAYAFTHADDIVSRVAELFGDNVKFDVIIGNPPYQLNDGGGEGASAVPIYHRFVQQAKALDPNELVMVIPARWYSGGKGLDDFRSTMLGDGHLAEIHDFPETDLVFPGVNIRGGVCYFRWSKSHSGDTKVVNYRKSGDPLVASRPALEPGLETFVRHNQATSILAKVKAFGEPTFDALVQSRNPFGIPSNFLAYSSKKTAQESVLLFRSRRGSSADKQVYVGEDQIESNAAWKDRIKVLVSKASPGGDEYPHAVLGRPFVAPKNSVCTETYLIVDFLKSTTEADHLVGYMQTRFFRFLVSLIKNTQNISKGSFAFVPVQDLARVWTDTDLYAKYSITDDEIKFIESMVRPAGEGDDGPSD
jgi:site-specific DNA-methyltransferase (adenine-specific)